PSAPATPSPLPTATPRPSATATARPTATPRPSATPWPTVTATPSPTATARPNVVQIPLGKVDVPVPNPDNGLLSSPLEGALTDAQPVSYSIPLSWTLPSVPPTLPVYPLTRT